MTGVGGGSLMTPLLILLFGIHPATAVGTDLLYAAVTKSCGAFVHGYSHTIDWRVVRRLATGSVPMTILTLSTRRTAQLFGARHSKPPIPKPTAETTNGNSATNSATTRSRYPPQRCAMARGSSPEGVATPNGEGALPQRAVSVPRVRKKRAGGLFGEWRGPVVCVTGGSGVGGGCRCGWRIINLVADLHIPA
jgi:hypothetical protein